MAIARVSFNVVIFLKSLLLINFSCPSNSLFLPSKKHVSVPDSNIEKKLYTANIHVTVKNYFQMRGELHLTLQVARGSAIEATSSDARSFALPRIFKSSPFISKIN